MPPRALLRYAVVSRLVDELAPRTVLEIGAGQGGFASRLAARAQYLGVEPDADSVAVAVRRVAPRGGTVIRGDDTAVPAGSVYDLVCAFEVLEHIEDDAGALARWARYVRPGGHLLLSVPAWPHRFGPMDEAVGHFRRYHPDAIGKLLAEAGLGEPRVTLYGWPLGYALEAVRNRIDRRKVAGPEQQPASMAERTGASGRTFQPSGALVGAAIQVATTPCMLLQRLAPHHGIGLIALARRPD
jgi:SAM-dependent methyltransferase